MGLVALTGDIISGSSINNDTHGAEHAEDEWVKVVGPMQDRNLNWAITYLVLVEIS